MAANEMQLNINEDTAGRMFVGRMPPSLIYINYLAGVELVEICSMSVLHAHADLHTNLPIHHTNYIAANEMQVNISGDAADQMFID